MIISKVVEFIPNESISSMDDILLLFKKKYELTCTKEHGFILEILSINKILSSTISIYNGNVILECELVVKNLLPIQNQVLVGKIKQVFPQGIIILTDECMKTFIPNSLIKNNKKIDIEIQFVIEQIRFQKGKYDCIGREISTRS